ncbi:MAG TPA: NADP-dependent oxidoreductase [Acidimicrobiales bacterium]|jgi:NADPH:quinone reductase-like Zn-dependent oxidoreductase|nr:NADP-dependent oxidoreductase [Acidimicrobiales bacterium]
MDVVSIVATDFGGPEVLSLVEGTLGDPGPDEVLVAVRAAGTNPVDYKMYSGAYGRDASQLPMSLGFEAAGIVVAVGDGVEGPSGMIRVGDQVIVFRASAAYASGLLAPANNVMAKPSAMSFEEASGLMLTGVTAIHALRAVGATAGDTLVIHGAAGGVGLMAVQVAVADGVRVIATAGDAQHDLLRSLGAEPVLYGEGLLDRIRAMAPSGVTAAIDLIGTDEAVDVSIALVTNRERLATIVSSERSRALGIQALGGGPGADPGVELRAAARLELLRRVDEGSLRVLVAATFPLVDVAAAHRQLAEGHTHGKIVLVP